MPSDAAVPSASPVPHPARPDQHTHVSSPVQYARAPSAAAELHQALPAVGQAALSRLAAPALPGETAGGRDTPQAPQALLRRLPSWINTLPLEYGDIQKVWLAPSPDKRPLVVLIQDAHNVPTAQKNIAGMLEHMGRGLEKGPLLVGLEGASGAFRLGPYRAHRDRKIQEAVGNYLLRNNYVSGPEYYGMLSPREPLLWGVEDQGLYGANVAAFRESLPRKEEFERIIQALEDRAGPLKARLYDPSLRDLDQDLRAYGEGSLDLLSHVRFLRKRAGEALVRRICPEVEKFLRALDAEENLDFAAVERERRALIQELSLKLDKAELSDLVSHSLAYRLGRLGAGAYYGRLAGLLERKGLRLRDYPAFEGYLAYVEMADRIDRYGLFEEMDRLTEAAIRQSARTPEQMELIRIGQDLGRLRKLKDQSFGPAEWEQYRARREEVLALGARLERLEGVSGGDRGATPSLARILPAFEGFYQAALERNRAMVENLLKQFQVPGSKFNTKDRESRHPEPGAGNPEVPVAALVAGGFHAPGLEALLKEQNISCVVMTPKLGELDKDGANYLDAFALNRTPLEKMLLGERLYLSPPRGMAQDPPAGDGLAGSQAKLETAAVAAEMALTARAAGDDRAAAEESLTRAAADRRAAFGWRRLVARITGWRRGAREVRVEMVTGDRSAVVRARAGEGDDIELTRKTADGLRAKAWALLYGLRARFGRPAKTGADVSGPARVVPDGLLEVVDRRAGRTIHQFIHVHDVELDPASGTLIQRKLASGENRSFVLVWREEEDFKMEADGNERTFDGPFRERVEDVVLGVPEERARAWRQKAQETENDGPVEVQVSALARVRFTDPATGRTYFLLKVDEKFQRYGVPGGALEPTGLGRQTLEARGARGFREDKDLVFTLDGAEVPWFRSEWMADPSNKEDPSQAMLRELREELVEEEGAILTLDEFNAVFPAARSRRPRSIAGVPFLVLGVLSLASLACRLDATTGFLPPLLSWTVSFSLVLAALVVAYGVTRLLGHPISKRGLIVGAALIYGGVAFGVFDGLLLFLQSQLGPMPALLAQVAGGLGVEGLDLGLAVILGVLSLFLPPDPDTSHVRIKSSRKGPKLSDFAWAVGEEMAFRAILYPYLRAQLLSLSTVLMPHHLIFVALFTQAILFATLHVVFPAVYGRLIPEGEWRRRFFMRQEAGARARDPIMFLSYLISGFMYGLLYEVLGPYHGVPLASIVAHSTDSLLKGLLWGLSGEKGRILPEGSPRLDGHAGFGVDVRSGHRAYASEESVKARARALKARVANREAPEGFLEEPQSVVIGEARFQVVVHKAVLERLNRQGLTVQEFFEESIKIRGPTHRTDLLAGLNGKTLVFDALPQSPALYGNCEKDGYVYLNVEAPIELDLIGLSHELMHEAGIFTGSDEDELLLSREDRVLLEPLGLGPSGLRALVQDLAEESSLLLQTSLTAAPDLTQYHRILWRLYGNRPADREYVDDMVNTVSRWGGLRNMNEVVMAAMIHRLSPEDMRRALAQQFGLLLDGDVARRVLEMAESVNLAKRLPYRPPRKGSPYIVRNQMAAVIKAAGSPEAMLLLLAERLQALSSAKEWEAEDIDSPIQQQIRHVYGPLADRLGRPDIAEDIWRASARGLLGEEAFGDLVQRVGEELQSLGVDWEDNPEDPYDVLDVLRARVEDWLRGQGIEGARILIRVKTPSSLILKMVRKKDLSKHALDGQLVNDLVSITVILPDETAMAKAHPHIVAALSPPAQGGRPGYEVVGSWSELTTTPGIRPWLNESTRSSSSRHFRMENIESGGLEVKLFPTPEDFQRYMSGDAAHWIYKLGQDFKLFRSFDREQIFNDPSPILGEDFAGNFWKAHESVKNREIVFLYGQQTGRVWPVDANNEKASGREADPDDIFLRAPAAGPHFRAVPEDVDRLNGLVAEIQRGQKARVKVYGNGDLNIEVTLAHDVPGSLHEIDKIVADFGGSISAYHQFRSSEGMEVRISVSQSPDRDKLTSIDVSDLTARLESIETSQEEAFETERRTIGTVRIQVEAQDRVGLVRDLTAVLREAHPYVNLVDLKLTGHEDVWTPVWKVLHSLGVWKGRYLDGRPVTVFLEVGIPADVDPAALLEALKKTSGTSGAKLVVDPFELEDWPPLRFFDQDSGAHQFLFRYGLKLDETTGTIIRQKVASRPGGPFVLVWREGAEYKTLVDGQERPFEGEFRERVAETLSGQAGARPFLRDGGGREEAPAEDEDGEEMTRVAVAALARISFKDHTGREYFLLMRKGDEYGLVGGALFGTKKGWDSLRAEGVERSERGNGDLVLRIKASALKWFGPWMRDARNMEDPYEGMLRELYEELVEEGDLLSAEDFLEMASDAKNMGWWKDRQGHAGAGVKVRPDHPAYASEAEVEADARALRERIGRGDIPPDFREVQVDLDAHHSLTVVAHREVLQRLAVQGLTVRALFEKSVQIRGPGYLSRDDYRSALLNGLNGKTLILDARRKSPNFYGNCRRDGYIYVNTENPAQELDVAELSHELMHEADIFSNSEADEAELSQQDREILWRLGVELEGVEDRVAELADPSSPLFQAPSRPRAKPVQLITPRGLFLTGVVNATVAASLLLLAVVFEAPLAAAAVLVTPWLLTTAVFWIFALLLALRPRSVSRESWWMETLVPILQSRVLVGEGRPFSGLFEISSRGLVADKAVLAVLPRFVQDMLLGAVQKYFEAPRAWLVYRRLWMSLLSLPVMVYSGALIVQMATFDLALLVAGTIPFWTMVTVGAFSIVAAAVVILAWISYARYALYRRGVGRALDGLGTDILALEKDLANAPLAEVVRDDRIVDKLMEWSLRTGYVPAPFLHRAGWFRHRFPASEEDMARREVLQEYSGAGWTDPRGQSAFDLRKYPTFGTPIGEQDERSLRRGVQEGHLQVLAAKPRFRWIIPVIETLIRKRDEWDAADRIELVYKIFARYYWPAVRTAIKAEGGSRKMIGIAMARQGLADQRIALFQDPDMIQIPVKVTDAKIENRDVFVQSLSQSLRENPDADVVVFDHVFNTGDSIVNMIDDLIALGVKPERIKIVGFVADPRGLVTIRQKHPNVDVHIAWYVPAYPDEKGKPESAIGDGIFSGGAKFVAGEVMRIGDDTFELLEPIGIVSFRAIRLRDGKMVVVKRAVGKTEQKSGEKILEVVERWRRVPLVGRWLRGFFVLPEVIAQQDGRPVVRDPSGTLVREYVETRAPGQFIAGKRFWPARIWAAMRLSLRLFALWVILVPFMGAAYPLPERSLGVNEEGRLILVSQSGVNMTEPTFDVVIQRGLGLMGRWMAVAFNPRLAAPPETFYPVAHYGWKEAQDKVEERLERIREHHGQALHDQTVRMIEDIKRNIEPRLYELYLTRIDHGLVHSLDVIDQTLSFADETAQDLRWKRVSGEELGPLEADFLGDYEEGYAQRLIVGIGLFHDLTSLLDRHNHHVTGGLEASRIMRKVNSEAASPVYEDGKEKKRPYIQDVLKGIMRHRGQNYPEPKTLTEMLFVDADELEAVNIPRLAGIKDRYAFLPHYSSTYRAYTMVERPTFSQAKERGRFTHELHGIHDKFSYFLFTLITRTDPREYRTEAARQKVRDMYPQVKRDLLEEARKKLFEQVRAEGRHQDEAAIREEVDLLMGRLELQVAQMEALFRTDMAPDARARLRERVGSREEVLRKMRSRVLPRPLQERAFDPERPALHALRRLREMGEGRNLALLSEPATAGLKILDDYLSYHEFDVAQAAQQGRDNPELLAGLAHGIREYFMDALADQLILVGENPPVADSKEARDAAREAERRAARADVRPLADRLAEEFLYYVDSEMRDGDAFPQAVKNAVTLIYWQERRMEESLPDDRPPAADGREDRLVSAKGLFASGVVSGLAGAAVSVGMALVGGMFLGGALLPFIALLPIVVAAAAFVKAPVPRAVVLSFSGIYPLILGGWFLFMGVAMLWARRQARLHPIRAGPELDQRLIGPLRELPPAEPGRSDDLYTDARGVIRGDKQVLARLPVVIQWSFYRHERIHQRQHAGERDRRAPSRRQALRDEIPAYFEQAATFPDVLRIAFRRRFVFARSRPAVVQPEPSASLRDSLPETDLIPPSLPLVGAWAGRPARQLKARLLKEPETRSLLMTMGREPWDTMPFAPDVWRKWEKELERDIGDMDTRLKAEAALQQLFDLTAKFFTQSRAGGRDYYSRFLLDAAELMGPLCARSPFFRETARRVLVPEMAALGRALFPGLDGQALERLLWDRVNRVAQTSQTQGHGWLLTSTALDPEQPVLFDVTGELDDERLQRTLLMIAGRLAEDPEFRPVLLTSRGTAGDFFEALWIRSGNMPSQITSLLNAIRLEGRCHVMPLSQVGREYAAAYEAGQVVSVPMGQILRALASLPGAEDMAERISQAVTRPASRLEFDLSDTDQLIQILMYDRGFFLPVIPNLLEGLEFMRQVQDLISQSA